MNPPKVLADLNVLSWAVVDREVTFTGKLNLYANGEKIGPCPRLIIAQHIENKDFLLLHCTQDWNILGIQVWNGPHVNSPRNISDVMKLAKKYYDGISSKWKLQNA